jgi:hypothetical protein
MSRATDRPASRMQECHPVTDSRDESKGGGGYVCLIYLPRLLLENCLLGDQKPSGLFRTHAQVVPCRGKWSMRIS